MPDDLTLFHYWVMAMSALSLLIATIAMLISFVNARRTNVSVLRILEVRGHGVGNALDVSKISNRLAVYVKNLGLPLHEPRLHLLLEYKDGSGSMKVALPRRSIENGGPIAGHAKLAKGMVALFEVRSEDLDERFYKFILGRLGGGQRFEIYDCGYFVQSFTIGGWRDRIGAQWNRLASRINSRFDRTITSDEGRNVLIRGSVVPMLRNWRWDVVDCFLHELVADQTEERAKA